MFLFRYRIGVIRFFCSDRNGYSIASRLSRHGGSTVFTANISSWTTSPMADSLSRFVIPRHRNRSSTPFLLWKASVYRVQPGPVYRVQSLGVSRAEVQNFLYI